MGTPFVPYDQLAFIHKGEAVIPSEYNPSNKTSYQGDTNIENHYHIGNMNFPNATTKIDDVIDSIANLPLSALQAAKIY